MKTPAEIVEAAGGLDRLISGETPRRFAKDLEACKTSLKSLVVDLERFGHTKAAFSTTAAVDRVNDAIVDLQGSAQAGRKDAAA